MRAWYKFESHPILGGRQMPNAVSTSYADHAADMGGYDVDGAYVDKQSFLRTYYFGSRNGIYESFNEFVRRYLKRTDRIISLGAGRCALEAYLFDDGYDVIGSDLGVPPSLDGLKRLFPGFQFVELDAGNLVSVPNYDQVLALDFLFILNRDDLQSFFTRCAKILEGGGGLTINYSGAADNWFMRFWDHGYLWLESIAHSALGTMIRPYKFATIRKEHGFRISDGELIQFAEQHGFHLVELQTSDYLTELRRSHILRRLADRYHFMGTLFAFLGRPIPYVRLMYFVKRSNSSK